MSTKNTKLPAYPVFASNFNQIIGYVSVGDEKIDRKARNVAAIKLGVVYEKVRTWSEGLYLPKGDALLNIKEKYPTISIDWLLTGDKPVNVRESSQGCDPECPLANSNAELKEHCKKVKAIIDSKTTYSGALKENIIAFHEAVEEKHARQAEIDALKDEMSKARTKHENEIKAINKRLNDLQSHQGHFSEESVAPPTGTDEGGGTER